MKLRIGVLASGRGSNFIAIDDNCKNGQINAQVVCVISDKPDSPVLKSARKRNIPALFLDPMGYLNRNAYYKAITDIFKQHNVQLVVLAGFMRIVTNTLLDAFPNAVMNIHPALLPAFPGLHAQRQALTHGVKFSGCTVHFVDEGTDTGPIIIQATVPVFSGDDEESLSARILKEEHRIYSEAIRYFTQRRLKVKPGPDRKQFVVDIIKAKKFNPR